MGEENECTENVMTHVRNPKHRIILTKFNGHSCITGPCGDTMKYWVQGVEDTVREIGFDTTGCQYSIACGSMAAELALGKTITRVLGIEPGDVLDALGPLPDKYRHCAKLAVNTLKVACKDYLKLRKDN
jgi:nitrogen fixation protein NifU and related proteins